MWILCLAEDSPETWGFTWKIKPYYTRIHMKNQALFSLKTMKNYLWITSAAVVIGALRVNKQWLEQLWLKCVWRTGFLIFIPAKNRPTIWSALIRLSIVSLSRWNESNLHYFMIAWYLRHVVFAVNVICYCKNKPEILTKLFYSPVMWQTISDGMGFLRNGLIQVDKICLDIAVPIFRIYMV